MLQHYRLSLALLIPLTAACPGDKGDTDSQGTLGSTDGATGTTLGSTDGATGTTDGATGPTGGTTGTTGPTGGGSTTAELTGGETAGLECSPTDLPACPATACREDWSYECPGCGEFLGGLCFEIDVGCAYPALNCDLPSPCPRVWGQGFDVIESLEDDSAAVCLLTALRDGTPGRFELLYGEMGDSPLVYMTLYSGGKDSVLVEYFLECQGCPDSGYFGRTGQLKLQPASFFDDCLAAPTPASLTQCVFGFAEFVAGAPPAPDYAPPWTTGECVDLERVCP